MSSRSVNSIGPFGGELPQGYGSYDEQYTGIKLIKLVYSDTINSMMVEYDDNGNSVWSTKHGEDINGVSTVVISFSFPEEYLVSVTGHYGHWTEYKLTVITSLTFKSNKNSYGPYGTERGATFSFPASCKKIVGFHGISGERLDSIGAYYEPWPFKIEAFGSKSGATWDDGINNAVKGIEIFYDDTVIHSVIFNYFQSGQFVWPREHRSRNGKMQRIELAYPEEYIISVSGSLSTIDDVSIGSLTFVTNVRRYGPIGADVGNKLCFPPGAGKILGFFGTSTSFLTSIGAYTEQAPVWFEPLGPFGGSGGTIWDDGQLYAGINEIMIHFHDHILGLTVTYADITAESIAARVKKHGSNECGSSFQISIAYPEEFLVSVTGYYDSRSAKVVKSLTFKTNFETYGPFGPEEGVSFSISATGCKIVGFHGRESQCINSIGAHLVYIPTKKLK